MFKALGFRGVLTQTTLVLICLAPVARLQADTAVTQRTSENQRACDATLGAGVFTVVWSSYLHDGNSGAVVARRFDPNGSPLDDEFVVNETTSGNQTAPTLAASPDGVVLVAWQSPQAEQGIDIMARIYDANAAPLTGEFTVNAATAGEQILPRAAATAAGDFFVAWESEDPSIGSHRVVCLRRVARDGSLPDPEIVASDTPAYTCRFADVVATPSAVVVTWLEDRSTNAVRQRRFLPDGTAQGASTQVNADGFKSLTWPDAAADPNGSVVIVWDGDPKRSADDDIHARLFDPNGIARGDAFLANADTPGAQRNPSVSVSATGDFLIAWDTDPNGQSDIRARRFGPTGAPLAGERSVNSHIPEDQSEPVVVFGDDNNQLIVWQSRDQDGSDWGLFAAFGPPAP